MTSVTELQSQRSQLHHRHSSLQYQHHRFLSDHLKQRAIDALKSKRSVKASISEGPDVSADETKRSNDPARGGGGNHKRVVNAASDTELTEENGIGSTKAKDESPYDKMPSQPVATGTTDAAPSFKKSDSTSEQPVESLDVANADQISPADAAAGTAATEDSVEDGASEDAPAVDTANPWAHVHLHEFAPKIVVVGVGGAGTNAVNNMVASGLAGVEFLALNTDAQHLSTSLAPTRLQIGTHLTSGLGELHPLSCMNIVEFIVSFIRETISHKLKNGEIGCGANPDAGRLAAEESQDAIQSCIEDAHMVFITAGMGGGTGTGAAPVVAQLCYDMGILTVSVVTTPFRFEGTHRKRLAMEGVERLKEVSDTLIVVPNQNLFRLVGEKTSFVDSFRLADNVLLAGVRSITDLMTSPGLINLDFADVQSVMHGMGNALLGTGQACHDDAIGSYGIGEARSSDKKDTENNNEEDSANAPVENECRSIRAAKMALNNPLLGEGNMDIGSAKGMLVNMTGGSDMTLYEVDRAAEYITEKVLDPDANIIFGSAYDANLTGCVRVSVVATGIEEANEAV